METQSGSVAGAAKTTTTEQAILDGKVRGEEEEDESDGGDRRERWEFLRAEVGA
jgi:hypothetical protein